MPRGGRTDQAVMIWRSGPDGGCTYFSKSWLAFTGRSMQDELGYGWAVGVHPDDLERCLRIYQSAFAVCREFQMQYRLRRHDGVYRWILDIGTPEWDEAGQFLGYIGSCVDVTEARQQGSTAPAGEPNGYEPPREPVAALTPRQSVAALTPRERDVLRLLARGLPNREIADDLVISVATVRVHVEHILTKLGFHSRAQVAAWAARQQLHAR